MGIVCVQLTHFSLDDWKDIAIAHVIIIIKSEVSTYPIVIMFFSVVVCLRCLLHHILLLIGYTFRENREFVFIIFVQFMMSANSRIRFGLSIVFIYLCATPSHYHQCENLSDNIELIKCLSNIFCRVCEYDKAHSLSYPLYNTWGWGYVFFSLPISILMIKRIYILRVFIIINSEVWTITYCLVLGHETMVCTVCLSVFLSYLYPSQR